jgi:hypothetical protein
MNEYLLFFSLFFPRISLFVAWLSGAIPPNGVPFWFEFFLTLFVPRALIIFYIGTTLGWNSGWLVAHVIAWLLAMLFGGSSASKSKKS